jgi:hypothetical protein
MTIRDIRPPEDVPALEAPLGTPWPMQRHAATVRHQSKAGTILEIEITSDALMFQHRAARLVVARDVSEPGHDTG